MDNHLTALITGISPAQTTFWKGLAAGIVNLGIGVNPNVAYLRRGKTRKTASDVAAHRFGQGEAYFTVGEVLSEPSTAADGVLSREFSAFYRCRYATLG